MKSIIFKCVLFGLIFFPFYSLSGVKPVHTREVMGTKSEHQVNIVNTSDEAYLVQAWLEDLNGKIKGLPLVLTPPIFSLEGNERGFVRILPLQNKLPQNKESLYYLLVQEIPQASKTDENTLKIAVRSKIKIILRPESVSASGLEEAASKLVWSLIVKDDKNYLRVLNETPYYFSFGQLKVSNSQRTLFLKDRFIMSSPFDTQDYQIPDDFNIKDLVLEFGIINDYGGITKSYIRNF